eukprot:SAG11_NODE_23046_length_396_cov_0.663300_2_plen_33_part_01
MAARMFGWMIPTIIHHIICGLLLVPICCVGWDY